MALGPPEDIHTERSHLDMHYSIEMLVCACVTVTGRCARRVVCVVLALCFESGYPVIGTRSSVSLGPTYVATLRRFVRSSAPRGGTHG